MSGMTERELAEAMARAWRIPGLYRKGEGRFLYQLGRRKGNFVELGCWMGRTTAILLQAARVWGASVTTVDPFVELPNGMTQATAERWSRNLRGIGLEPAELLEMTSDAAAQVYDREVALLFIDADHSRGAVASDLANWTPLVKAGGVVALHDMFYPSVTGVCQAVAAWWSRERDGKSPRWELIGQYDYTIAFRRVA